MSILYAISIIAGVITLFLVARRGVLYLKYEELFNDHMKRHTRGDRDKSDISYIKNGRLAGQYRKVWKIWEWRPK